MQILEGKAVAAKVLAEVKAGVAALSARTGVQPTLAVILVGEDPASQIYVRNKKRAADDVGIASRDFLFPAGCSQAELTETIRKINGDPSVHAILLQLPLPKGLALQRFRSQMPNRFEPAKGPVALHGVVIRIDPDTGRGLSIERLRVPLPD